MSVVVTKVMSDKIYMAADIGFSDDSMKWTDRNTLKIVPHTDYHKRDVLVGVTGSASQLSIMRAFLRQCNDERRAIDGDDDGIFSFIVEYNKFAQNLGVPTGVEVDGAFSEFHIVAQGRAWVAQNYFISEIIDWNVMGSGDPFARAAMSLGFSPVEAVAEACKHDLYCYGPPVSFIYDKEGMTLLKQGDTYEQFHDGLL